jgi:hypothetical protein
MFSSMKIRHSKVLVFFCLSISIFSSGCNDDDGPDAECNDPAALNFEPNSTTNAGCTYPTSLKPVTAIGELPGGLDEISGLASFQDFLIAHNDRSNTSTFFFIDPENGEIEATIDIAGAPNNDWEDMAQSEEYFFIGDFGNNEGSRTDLGIHRVPVSALNVGGTNIANADGTIFFSYPDQVRFDLTEHNFDCEAAFYFDGAIYLFTRHRTDRRTKMYRVPADPSAVQVAELLGSFEAGGRITGADINADGTIVALTGNRTSGNCFVWKLYDFEGSNFLSGKKEQAIMGPFSQFGQVESVRFKSDTELYVANEETEGQGLAPRLYLVEEF